MAGIRLVAGNWYRFQEQDGTQHIGQYYGREHLPTILEKIGNAEDIIIDQ